MTTAWFVTRVASVRLRTLIGLAAVLVILVLASCGGGANQESRKLGKESIATASPPNGAAVTEKVIDAYPHQSPTRAFLQFWFYLQHQAWNLGVESYEPGLRQFLGDDRLAESLKAQAAFYRGSRPRINGVRRVRRQGSQVILPYTANTVTGEPQTTSVTMTRKGGRWYIAYDPTLDAGLTLEAQTRVQQQIDPAAQRMNKRALAAGIAASRLQTRFLERQQRARQTPSPAPGPSAGPSAGPSG